MESKRCTDMPEPASQKTRVGASTLERVAVSAFLGVALGVLLHRGIDEFSATEEADSEAAELRRINTDLREKQEELKLHLMFTAYFLPIYEDEGPFQK